MRPTFVVIGAMKSGTTSLYYYLNEHPEIGMSTVKETDFFIEENHYGKGLLWYESLFPEEPPARGEVSPNYAKRHLFAGVPERMKAALPKAKLIYLLRDPVKRTISHYVSSYAQRREDRSLEAALRSLDGNNYVLTSKYHWQLQPYLAHYPLGRILIVSSRHLKTRRQATLRRVYRFLDVDDTFQNERSAQFNAATGKKRQHRWYRFVSDHLLSQRLKDGLRPYVPAWLLPGTSFARPTPSEALRARLIDAFEDDVAALRACTDRRFDHWCL